MSSLRDDLDRFLKTDGLRILRGAKAAGIAARQALVLKGFGPVGGIRTEGMDEGRLNKLLGAAEEKQEELESQLDALEELIGSVEDRLEASEEVY